MQLQIHLWNLQKYILTATQGNNDLLVVNILWFNVYSSVN